MKMLRAALLVVLITAFAFAQTPSVETNVLPKEKPAPTIRYKMLEKFSYDLHTHELSWEVAEGKMDGEEFKAYKIDTYKISPDKAVMIFNGEEKSFSQREADELHQILNMLSQYTKDSTVWWYQVREPEHSIPAAPPKTNSAEKPVRL